jgi:hypothetical protein
MVYINSNEPAEKKLKERRIKSEYKKKYLFPFFFSFSLIIKNMSLVEDKPSKCN